MGAPPLPAMSGSELFANDRLLVEATIGRGFRPDGRGGPGGGGGGHGPRGGGAGGFRGAGGPRGARGAGGEQGWRQRQDSNFSGGEGEMDRDEMRPRMQESRMPAVVIQLHATNRGTEPIDVSWVECNSAFGNFGVLPEKMTIAPGATAKTEHMRSLLGASGEDIPVTVTLRVAGKTEKKTITVRASPDAKPAAQP